LRRPCAKYILLIQGNLLIGFATYIPSKTSVVNKFIRRHKVEIAAAEKLFSLTSVTSPVSKQLEEEKSRHRESQISQLNHCYFGKTGKRDPNQMQNQRAEG
jgi:hypothetical protein